MATSFSFLFWICFALSSVPLFAVALLLWLVTLPFDRNGRVLHLYSCFWAQLYFYLNPLWRLRIEGRRNLPWRGGAVIVSNHSSMGDILILFGLYRPFKWVSKASNFRLPLIGWNMRLNRYVSLVRGDKESIGRMISDCERWLGRGVPVLLFPEGTRSPDGAVGPFKDGAFKLAISTGCPLIPVALSGTSEVIPKHGWVLRKRADCRVRVLEAIDPRQFGGDAGRLRDEARARIIAAKREMDASPSIDAILPDRADPAAVPAPASSGAAPR